MSGYTKEQQVEDLAITDKTISLLSARIAGERQNECEIMLPDYVRIARYFDEELGDSVITKRSIARMFFDLVEQPKISAFKIGEYSNLLAIVKRKIRSKLIRRRKKTKTCFKPDEHIQPCYCANLARAQANEGFGELQEEDRELRRLATT